MGGCISCLFKPKEPIISFRDGDEDEYRRRFVEDRVLGEGEFGVVKMVHRVIDSTTDGDTTTNGNSNHDLNNNEPLAVKILRKGMVFKDNTLYTPLSPQVLYRECFVLRTLAGLAFNLKLESVYETPSLIYIVTELCVGGEMMEWVVGTGETLHTHDVARIASELLQAVAHCHRHGVIHRDIKPENIMFKTKGLNSPLRLIDFGGCDMDTDKDKGDSDGEAEETAPPALEQAPMVNGTSTSTTYGEAPQEDAEEIHTSFAGTPFYISPEMFQHRYTSKTDMWSVGVTMYVLVAGYPSAQLQQAFNLLHVSSKDRNLRELPNLPDNLPPSYFDMLQMLLNYKHRQRDPAKNVLQDSQFIQFYQATDQEQQEQEDEEDDEEFIDLATIQHEAATFDADPTGGSMNGLYNTNPSLSRKRSHKTALEGSTHRHYLYLGFQKFERSLTTLLAATLTPQSYGDLVHKLHQRFQVKTTSFNDRKLKVIKVDELKKVLLQQGEKRVANMIDMIPNAELYNSFAYHTALLKLFTQDDLQQAVSKYPMDRSMRQSNAPPVNTMKMNYRGALVPIKVDNDDNINKKGNSVHGSNVYASWKNKLRLSSDNMNNSTNSGIILGANMLARPSANFSASQRIRQMDRSR